VSDAIAAAGPRTSTGLSSRKLAFWAFLGSECLFFGSLLSTYLIYKGRSLAGPTPHQILNIPFTSVSTFVLLMSSLTMVLALAGIQRGHMGRFRLWIAATALLGMTFLAGQVIEFSTFVREGLTLQGSLFGASFFVLTGFHGAHVTGGVIWLWSLFAASFGGRVRPENALDVEIAGLYWHFVDVVWIAIFTLVYLIQ
jgi:heme/copper-type cytochrome/quinol oxidase subunit 3